MAVAEGGEDDAGQIVVPKAPGQVRTEAQERVQHLEAVLSTYGGIENAETSSLKEMIRWAKEQAKVPPTADRIKSCEEFIGRATRRLEKAEDEVAKALAKKESVKAELSRAQSDLVRMRAELSQEPIPPRSSESKKLQRLRGLVAQFERERDSREHVAESESAAWTRNWRSCAHSEISTLHAKSPR